MSVEKAKGHIIISYVETLFEYQKYMNMKKMVIIQNIIIIIRNMS